MKNIDFTQIGLGMELSPSFSKQSMSAMLERLTSILKGITNNAAGVVILEGCVMTVVGTNYTQTAGVVYYNGEVLSVDAFAGSHATNIPVYQAPTNTYTDQVWYGDGVKRDTFYVRKLPLAMAASGTGASNYNQAVRIEDIKANKTQAAWTNISLASGWQSWAGVTAQYFTDSFGQVHLRGFIGTTNATGNDTVSTVGAVPGLSGLGGNRSTGFLRSYSAFGGGGRIGVAELSIQSTGTIFISKSIAPSWTPGTVDVGAFSLEGMSYWPSA
jgi:hypothetical protein